MERAPASNRLPGLLKADRRPRPLAASGGRVLSGGRNILGRNKRPGSPRHRNAPEALEGSKSHSYGGEGAAYVGAMSKVFAAVGMGAGVVDLANDFAMNWGWSYGVQGGSGDWRTRTRGATSAEWRIRKT